ncbi:unnamed protein product [Tenebrio molitor]|nr:unnamed protein product [Tenebrio molitor]
MSCAINYIKIYRKGDVELGHFFLLYESCVMFGYTEKWKNFESFDK